MIPDQVQLFLHVPDLCSSYYHGILFGKYKDVLSVSAVRPESVVAAAPHLVALALQPVTCGRIDSAFPHLDLIPAGRA